jgi:hypothetical protein
MLYGNTLAFSYAVFDYSRLSSFGRRRVRNVVSFILRICLSTSIIFKFGSRHRENSLEEVNRSRAPARPTVDSFSRHNYTS